MCWLNPSSSSPKACPTSGKLWVICSMVGWIVDQLRWNFSKTHIDGNVRNLDIGADAQLGVGRCSAARRRRLSAPVGVDAAEVDRQVDDARNERNLAVDRVLELGRDLVKQKQFLLGTGNYMVEYFLEVILIGYLKHLLKTFHPINIKLCFYHIVTCVPEAWNDNVSSDLVKISSLATLAIWFS